MDAVLVIIAVVDIVLLVTALALAAAKGFTIAEVGRIWAGASRRFWSGERDWSKHGNEDAGRKP